MEDQMECVCGEILKSEVRGGLDKQFREHLMREDHQNSPAQWAEAHKRIEAAKEAAKSAKSTEE